jgi:hypothetical protein
MPNYIRQINSEITYKNKGEDKTIKGIIEFSLDKIKGLEEQINRLDEIATKRFPMEITSTTTAHSNSASSSSAATAAATTATPLTADTNNYKTSINSDLEDKIRDPHIAISMANINKYGEKLPEDCNGPTCKIMGGRRRTMRSRSKAKSSRRYKKKTSRSRRYRSSNKK